MITIEKYSVELTRSMDKELYDYIGRIAMLNRHSLWSASDWLEEYNDVANDAQYMASKVNNLIDMEESSYDSKDYDGNWLEAKYHVSNTLDIGTDIMGGAIPYYMIKFEAAFEDDGNYPTDFYMPRCTTKTLVDMIDIMS